MEKKKQIIESVRDQEILLSFFFFFFLRQIHLKRGQLLADYLDKSSLTLCFLLGLAAG